MRRESGGEAWAPACKTFPCDSPGRPVRRSTILVPVPQIRASIRISRGSSQHPYRWAPSPAQSDSAGGLGLESVRLSHSWGAGSDLMVLGGVVSRAGSLGRQAEVWTEDLLTLNLVGTAADCSHQKVSPLGRAGVPPAPSRSAFSSPLGICLPPSLVICSRVCHPKKAPGLCALGMLTLNIASSWLASRISCCVVPALKNSEESRSGSDSLVAHCGREAGPVFRPTGRPVLRR